MEKNGNKRQSMISLGYHINSYLIDANVKVVFKFGVVFSTKALLGRFFAFDKSDIDNDRLSEKSSTRNYICNYYDTNLIYVST